jgi:modulator of FtsH protease
MDRIITSSRDRSSLLSTHKVLRNTYFLLSLTLAFSAITATASTVLMLPSPGLILTLVGMYGLMFLTYKTANNRRVFFLLSPLPASWVISWADAERVSFCGHGRYHRPGAGRYRAGVLLLLGLCADHA